MMNRRIKTALLLTLPLMLNATVPQTTQAPSMDAETYNTGRLKSLANTGKKPLEQDKNAKPIELDLKELNNLNEAKSKVVEQAAQIPDVDYTDAQILNAMNKASANIYKANNTFQKVNLYPIKPQVASQLAKAQNSDATSAKNKQSTMVQGICEINYDISIADAMTREFICKTDKGFAKLNLTLQPQNEVFMLMGIPNFLIFDSNSDYKFGENDKTMTIDKTKSIVSNYDGNSNQLATIVDYKKIAKAANIAQKEYSSAMIKATEQSIEQQRAADEQQVLSADQNGNLALATNTKEPDIATNFLYGLVDGTLRVTEKIAEMNEDKNPTLYKILKGSKFKITLYGDIQ